MVDLAQLQQDQAQARRDRIVAGLQAMLAANDRRLSPSSRRAVLDAIGELSPIDRAAANGIVSASLQPVHHDIR